MLRKFGIAVMAAVMLMGAGTALAQNPPQHDTHTTEVTGTVVSIDDMMLVIQTDDGELNFTVNTDTQLPETRLEMGERVRVWHDAASADGSLVVTRVERVDTTGLAVETTRDDARATREAEVAAEQRFAAEDTRETDPLATERSYGMRDELPRTADNLPLTALLGALAIVGALGLRLVGRAF